MHLITCTVCVSAYLHPLAFFELLSCFDPNLTEIQRVTENEVPV